MVETATSSVFNILRAHKKKVELYAALQAEMEANLQQINISNAQIAQNLEQINKNEQKLKALNEQLIKLRNHFVTIAGVVVAMYLSVVFALVYEMPSLFVNVTTEFGSEAYAEEAFWFDSQPRWLIMPANTLVNSLYIFVGIYWLRRLTKEDPNVSCYIDFFSLFQLKGFFCWASVFYGFVQALRLVVQDHLTAVVDQWVTLPIFSLAGLMCLVLTKRTTSYITLVLAHFFSTISFVLAIFYNIGFEIALGIHICLVVGVAVELLRRVVDDKHCRWYFGLAIASCIGFVVLKILDSDLAACHSIFCYLSGHFWSKVCDVLQIHFTLLFVESCQTKLVKSEHSKKRN